MIGCSSKNNSDDGHWNQKEGYVVAKEISKVLVVRDEVANIDTTPLSEILKVAKPNAIWLSVDKAD